MKRARSRQLWLGSAAALALLLGGCLGLAADITPPPDQALRAGTAAPTAAVTEAVEGSSPTALPTAEPGTVAVWVIDQTSGDLLGQELEITLEGYDEFDLAYQDALPVPDSGQVVFGDVPISDGRVFFASLPYGGAVYRSEIVQADQSTESFNLTIPIYETTTDRTGLVIDRLHVLVDFSQPGLAQIAEIFILSNLGSETIVAAAPGEPSVEFPLPADALAIDFEDGAVGQRYLLTETGFGDTVSIPPGPGVYQVLVYYSLPYERDRVDFAQVLAYPLSAGVIMLPAGQGSITGGDLADLGLQSLPNEQVQLYSSDPLASGETLSFRITGAPSAGATGLDVQSNLSQAVVYGAGALGLVLLASGAWLYLRNKRRTPQPRPAPRKTARKEEILDSIIALEDLYQEGAISRSSYQKKLAELKGQLKLTSRDGGK